MARIRYIVNDVNESIKFYTLCFGFEVEQDYSPNMAILKLGDLTLWLAVHKVSATKSMSDGSVPAPGGWSRFVLPFDDLEVVVAELENKGAKFKK